MQITLDLPDDAFQIADALAKRESRSLSSVIVDLIRGRRPLRSPQPVAENNSPPVSTLPLVECRRKFTLEEIDAMLEDDALS